MQLTPLRILYSSWTLLINTNIINNNVEAEVAVVVELNNNHTSLLWD